MEKLIINSTDKASIYKEIIPQVENIISPEFNIISNLANIAAILKEAFNFYWVGFYLVNNERLELGPFQGPLACCTIQYGRGVCGSAWKEGKTIVVEDVDKFPGHIACSSASRSEIVVPLFDSDNKIYAVLDIDSTELADFDVIDKEYLEIISGLICKTKNNS